jgi:phage gp29-like protein
MSRKKKNKITVGGNMPRPGQPYPTTVVLTQPKRFGIDISDYIAAVRAMENVDYSRRYKLYDLYADILMDTHLSGVIDRRIFSVLSSNIEFRRDGKPDDAISEQIRSPWFRRLVKDVLDAQFWGFTLCQFYRDVEWVNYDLIPRKHADPVRRLILRYQTDITGVSWDEYADLLFVGDRDSMGLLAKAAPWVIYKRNTTADWAQFSEVFGMPIREYTYETDDDEARRRALDDAMNTGSIAVFVHSSDSAMKLVESNNKTGSADLYERLCERCNNEISKLILGNTLTTEASDKGTQALGTVHKKAEEVVAESDRRYVLDVLNYNMTDIFLSMGINTEGGEFCFIEPKDISRLKEEINILATLKNAFNLPISDDYLYEQSGVEKPKDYAQLKEQGEPEPPAPATPAKTDPDNEKKKKAFADRLKGFFVQARCDRAALDW